MLRRFATLLTPAALLSSCSPEPAATTYPRPEWARHAFEGLAPLMSPTQVKAALDAGGYRAERCLSDSPQPDPAALGTTGTLKCFESARSGWRVTLAFFGTDDSALLEKVYFDKPGISHDPAGHRARQAAGVALLAQVRQRFGPPHAVLGTGDRAIYQWFVPGGSSVARDHISVEAAPVDPPELEMTSFWVRPQYRSAAEPGKAE